MGKERETEREQVKEKREREAARNTVRYQSSQWSFDSGRGGARVRKTRGERLGELFKEGERDLSGSPH